MDQLSFSEAEYNVKNVKSVEKNFLNRWMSFCFGNRWKARSVVIMLNQVMVDDASGCIHNTETRSANEHDITAADKLLHGDEERVWGDAG